MIIASVVLVAIDDDETAMARVVANEAQGGLPPPPPRSDNDRIPKDRVVLNRRRASLDLQETALAETCDCVRKNGFIAPFSIALLEDDLRRRKVY